tara:strand:+ start:269 stop:964 length:696 start_codon:yes stop_codon:yes gene_type:complete
MTTKMDWFIENLQNGIPFGYARFNDGEMMAIDNIGAVVARGDQVVDESLHEALNEAIIYKQERYYVGIPCSLCYPRLASLAREVVGDYDYITSAVATTNRNWKHFITSFPIAMEGRRMIWIGGNDQNSDAIKDLGITVAKTALIPRQNSWRFYEKIRESVPQYFEPGDVVGISLGPTARVLVRRWFQEYPDITFIDMGSNLDPYTRNVQHNCHKGWDETGFNLTKRCAECN